jgi:hypothetical protein
MLVVSPFNQETGYGKSVFDGHILIPNGRDLYIDTVAPRSTIDIVVAESDLQMIDVRVEAMYYDPSAMSNMSLCSFPASGLGILVSIDPLDENL